MPRKAIASDESPEAGGATQAPPDAHVVICDDDSELRRLLGDFLSEHGFAVTLTGDGRDLNRHVRMGAPVDLVILDVMLPGQSGIDICRDLRATSNVPILMLTARDNETDRIVGLEIGADDYISKPFSPNELLARIKALLRRARIVNDGVSSPRRRALEFEGWRLDLARRELRSPQNVLVDLSAGEYDLLLAFLEAPQRILSRDHLMDAAKSRSPSAFDRSIDVQISRLRRKIDISDEDESFIKTVRGAGYMFVPAVQAR